MSHVIALADAAKNREIARLRRALAVAEDKNATLMRDLELACRDLAAVKLSRDAAEAKLADAEKHADELAREIDLGPCPCCLAECGTQHDSECTYENDAPVQAKLWRAASEVLAAHAARRAGNAGEREEGKR